MGLEVNDDFFSRTLLTAFLLDQRKRVKELPAPTHPKAKAEYEKALKEIERQLETLMGSKRYALI